MKDVGLAVITIVAITAVIVAGVFWNAKSDFQYRLEVSEAIAATGPCGDKFIVVLSDGKNVVVAGQVRPAEEAGDYYLTPSPLNLGEEVEIWKKTEGSPDHPTPILRRCRCAQK